MNLASEAAATQPASPQQLERIALVETARNWLFDDALPFWLEHGIDRLKGGFHDLVSLDGSAIESPKRTFVQARQIFTFATAGELKWTGPWREVVETGLENLDRFFKHADWGVCA